MKPEPQLRVEVEPLGDARWARIERDLFAKLDERPLPGPMPPARDPVRRRTFAFAAAAALAVAATVAVVIVSSRAMRFDGEMSLKTGPSASEVTVGESALTVAPQSLVMVRGDDDHGIDVVLDRGTVTCAVAPRNGRPPFRLNAGDVRIRVIGTKFTVTREGGHTSVDVDHGAVEVAARGVVTVLHDGEHWPTAGGGAPGAQSSSSSLGSREGSAPATGRQAGRAARSRRSPTDDTSFPMPDLSDSEPEAPETAAPPPATAPVAQPPTAPAAPAPPSVDPSQQAYEAASRKERSNPAEAEAIYRQIISNGTGWAPNALFELGRLEASRGHRAEATRLLNSYLVRYPHGINVDDARELLRSMR